jgi:hypothetical protein
MARHMEQPKLDEHFTLYKKNILLLFIFGRRPLPSLVRVLMVRRYIFFFVDKDGYLENEGSFVKTLSIKFENF